MLYIEIFFYKRTELIKLRHDCASLYKEKILAQTWKRKEAMIR